MKTKLFFLVFLVALSANLVNATSHKISPCNLPAAPAVPNGAPCITVSTTGNIYTIPAVTGATSYKWTISPSTSAMITSGQGTTSIFITAGSTPGPVNICVYASDSCGNSDTICYLVNIVACMPPLAPSTIMGPSNPPLSTASTYTIPTVSGATSYTWSVSNTSFAAITGGQGTTSATITTTSTPGTYTICVYASNNCCNSETVCFTVTSGTTSVWDIVNSISGLKIAPNPGTGIFTIGYSLKVTGYLQFTLINELGQVVYSNAEYKTAGDNEEQLNFQNLPEGIYTLRLQNNSSSITRKLSIVK
jgi:hypothetical protein